MRAATTYVYNSTKFLKIFATKPAFARKINDVNMHISARVYTGDIRILLCASQFA